MNDNKYDEEKMSKAQRSLILRIIVAAYLFYLGVKIFNADHTTISVMLSYVIGIFFIASALAFGAFAVLRMHNDVAAAKIADAEGTEKDQNGAVQ